MQLLHRADFNTLKHLIEIGGKVVQIFLGRFFEKEMHLKIAVNPAPIKKTDSSNECLVL